MIFLKYSKNIKPFFELWFRAKDLLSLAIIKACGKNTVIKIYNKKLEVSNRKFVVFATFPNSGLTEANLNLLREFEINGYTIVVATNKKAIEYILDGIPPTWVLIHRRPYGRDFGCYKDSLKYLVKNYKNISQIVFANDSLHYFLDFSKQAVDFFNSNFDYMGLTENFNNGYHVSSYFFSVSDRVIYNKKFLKYWDGFIPYNTRTNAIKNGELKLSKTIIREGFPPIVKYNISEIMTKLARLDLYTVSNLWQFMEADFINNQGGIYKVFDKYLNEEVFNEVKTKEDKHLTKILYAQFMKLLKTDVDSTLLNTSENEINKKLGFLKKNIIREREEMLNIPNNLQKQIAIKGSKALCAQTIVDYILRGSNIHHGYAPLLFIGANVLKRDIVFRGILKPSLVSSLISESQTKCSEEEIKILIADLSMRGTHRSLKGMQRLLYKMDFI